MADNDGMTFPIEIPMTAQLKHPLFKFKSHVIHHIEF